MSELTHFDAQGQAHMVDVSDKPSTVRVAVATGVICMQAATWQRIQSGQAGKGDVLGVARIAGIQGAKRTADWIPLCHPIPLTRVAIEFDHIEAQDAVRLRCSATVQTVGGVWIMRALRAVPSLQVVRLQSHLFVTIGKGVITATMTAIGEDNTRILGLSLGNFIPLDVWSLTVADVVPNVTGLVDSILGATKCWSVGKL